MRKIQMDCLPGLSGRLAHLQSSNILITKMKSLLAELNMRYFNSANGFTRQSLRQTIGLDSPFWAQYWLIGRQSGFGLFVLSLFVCLKRPPLPETSAWDAASRWPADPSVHLRIWRLGSQRPSPACIFRIGHLRSRRTAAVRSACSLSGLSAEMKKGLRDT